MQLLSLYALKGGQQSILSIAVTQFYMQSLSIKEIHVFRNLIYSKLIARLLRLYSI